MLRSSRTPLLAAALLVAATATAAQGQYYAYGLSNATGTQQLVRYTTNNTAAVTTLGATGVTLQGIDFNVANGLLYGFDGTRLYTVNVNTGAATAVGMMGSATTTGSAAADMDFNPVPNLTRVVSGNASYRYNQGTGLLVQRDGDLTFGSGAPVNATAAAYTNNDTDASTGTTFLVIDNASGTLVRVMPPNDGVSTSVGNLGLGTNLNVTGFDIFTVGGVNMGFFTTLSAGVTNLYAISFASDGMGATLAGSATLVGTVGGAGLDGLAISAVPEPGTWALMGAGLAGLAGVARRRRRSA